MACNCNSPSLPPPVTGLPALLDLTGPPHCHGANPAECCGTDCNDGEESTGTNLDLAFTDARCARPDEGVTLLGRIGRRLAKLVGNGFIQLVDGKAFVVSSVPIVLRQLWHDYWLSTGTVPVVGAPKAFPFGVVADSLGNIYGIQGLASADSVHVWSHAARQWGTLSLDKLPQSISRRLAGSDGIELIGYDPISVINSPTVVRALKALSGQGIVYLTTTPVGVDDPAPGCEACEGSAFASVARVLTFPTIIPGEGETGRHRLVYSSEGLYWEPEA